MRIAAIMTCHEADEVLNISGKISLIATEQLRSKSMAKPPAMPQNNRRERVLDAMIISSDTFKSLATRASRSVPHDVGRFFAERPFEPIVKTPVPARKRPRPSARRRPPLVPRPGRHTSTRESRRRCQCHERPDDLCAHRCSAVCGNQFSAGG